MTAYYNENDPFAANWLRNLIKAGHIADGFVDDRSIIDVQPEELHQYTQCHFFAGIGGWSHALRLAGWPDDRAVWTGSPPCQPFSTAGLQRGKDDARHLAPHWLELVTACRPVAVFGEQVAAAIRHGWIDDLQNALEREDYATGAIVLPACSIGAPHLRQRLWFTAHRMADPEGIIEQHKTKQKRRCYIERGGYVGGLGDTDHQRLERLSGHGDNISRPGRQEPQQAGPTAQASGTGGLADTEHNGRDRQEGHAPEQSSNRQDRRVPDGSSTTGGTDQDHSFWADADWLGCRGGKWRPVEPGTFPLVNGATARVGRLRGYGNAIIPQVAAQIIKAMM